MKIKGMVNKGMKVQRVDNKIIITCPCEAEITIFLEDENENKDDSYHYRHVGRIARNSDGGAISGL